MSSARRVVRLEWLLGACLVTLTCGHFAHGGAFATAGGGGFEMEPKFQESQGSDKAVASVGGGGEFGIFNNTSVVAHDSGSVSLAAIATADGFPGIPEDAEGVGAGGFAIWEDYLELENKDVVNLGLLGVLQFFFQPSVRGKIDGTPDGQASFNVIVDDEQQFVDFMGPGVFGHAMQFLIPGHVFGPVLGVLPEVYLRMELSVAASAHADQSSIVDFANTATLGVILVGDENGNYVPGSENIRLVGRSGLSYSVMPVPEPSTYVMATMGIVAVLFARRRKP